MDNLRNCFLDATYGKNQFLRTAPTSSFPFLLPRSNLVRTFAARVQQRCWASLRRESPYPNDLVIVTKVGARRGADKSWIPALSRQELIDAVQDNLRNLGLDVLEVVNLRVGEAMAPSEGSIEEPLSVLNELKQQGLIRHIGLSNVTPSQLAQAQTITEIVCIQNLYNLAHRDDDAFIDDLAAEGIAYVPFFHWEDSVHYRHRHSMKPQLHCKPRQCRLRLRGSSSVHPRSC
jgi:predicted oxidoreductase